MGSEITGLLTHSHVSMHWVSIFATAGTNLSCPHFSRKASPLGFRSTIGASMMPTPPLNHLGFHSIAAIRVARDVMLLPSELVSLTAG